MDIAFGNKNLECVVSSHGGCIWHLEAIKPDGSRISLLRPPPPGKARDILQSGCFPLVPFGNRVAGNSFTFEGRDFHLAPNTAWDAHYLHGDGWLSDWTIACQGDDEAELTFETSGEIYSYRARQGFRITAQSLSVSLSIENTGPHAMPFGCGWHPFFPMTSETRLTAPARTHWTERAGWLPDKKNPVPPDLDFSQPRQLPQRWVNNGFEGWSGHAAIDWPHHRLHLSLQTMPALERYFVFVSDTQFDPDFRGDFFCFEPMSHTANGHNLPDLGGLTVLAPGEQTEKTMVLSWSELPEEKDIKANPEA